MGHGTSEIEIKLSFPSVDTAKARLREVGFRLYKRRIFEANTVFDTPQLRLRKAALLLRIRQAGKTAILTYKGRPVPGKHKSREERELVIPDGDTMAAILNGVGFRPMFRYEKYRTEFQQARGQGIAMLDETPIGTFVELEGAPAWIDRTARQMGFSEADYITKSYGLLYREWCRRNHVKPTHMVFSQKA